MKYGSNDGDDFDRRKQQAERYINDRLGEVVGERASHKEVAREVAERFRILLTPGEVKDIHCEGWGE